MAISLYELSQRISSSMPLGTIVPYYGTDEPSGWKICDGRSCAGSELAKKLGISNVPDLRGRFIRMIGGNAAGMAVAQGDCIRNVTGDIYCSNYIGYSGSGVFYAKQWSLGGHGGNSSAGSKIGFDASRQVPTGPENRPINTAFNYIIKVNTNVILYYVSNIIYKAIAIGKSLLSRAKEEVRRTMAISLKNHEDRIVALERPLEVRKLLQLDFTTSNDYANLSRSDYENYDYLVFLTDAARDAKTSSGSGCYRDFRFIPVKILTNYINDFCFQPGFTFNTTQTNGVLYYESFECQCDGNSNLTIRSLYNSYGAWADNRVIVFGLKQYYCFSNNIIIYKLTQILFNSSLLGLFSQKGGARTI